MSRRKPLRVRYPSGQIVPRSEIASPTAIRRLTDAAVAGLRDASWGTMLGRIYLAEKISASEYAAGKRWAALTAEYAVACQAPRAPTTVLLDAVGGRPPDPDSEIGRKEVKRHEKANREYLDGRHALRLAGRNAEAVVEATVVLDQACTCFDEIKALRDGLGALATMWASKRHGR